MKKEMFYESPMIMTYSIESEGVLCGSFENEASFSFYDEEIL